MGLEEAILISRVWRAKPRELIVFFTSLVLSVVLSLEYPSSVITVTLPQLADYIYVLTVPLWCFGPAGVLCHLVWWIYDAQYVLGARGLESREGIFSVNQRITRVSYEDIRSMEVKQNLLQRALDTGSVLIGTSATQGVEVTMAGIASPREVLATLQREKDRRKREMPSGEVSPTADSATATKVSAAEARKAEVSAVG